MKVVPEDHLEKMCKFGSGPEVCIYLVMAPDGFSCVKKDEVLGPQIKSRKSDMTAQGDNCEGLD